ncbi:MAG: SIS domain-containing protein [Caldilineaceae bacterium]|nr:SIS domain-containing protein [Caldilineaceae bacterium]
MSDLNALMPIAYTQTEVAEQPAVVERVLGELHANVRTLAHALTERAIQRLYLLGSGDSWFAGLATRLAFEEYSGLITEPLQAYEYAAYGHPGLNAHSAAILISSSGRPTTTWDALDRALAAGAYVVGITDNPYDGNPFVHKPHSVLIPGAQKKGLPAQTTSATMAMLMDLAIELGRANGHLAPEKADALVSSLCAMPTHMQDVLTASAKPANVLAQALHGRRVYTLVGGGPSYGVAQIGSALLAEGPQEVGLPLTVEEFHHGLRYGAIGKGDPVILIAPGGAANQRNLETTQSLANWGAHLIAIVDERDTQITPLAQTVFTTPAVPEAMSPLLTLLPLHNLAVQLALHKMANGYQRPTFVP